MLISQPCKQIINSWFTYTYRLLDEMQINVWTVTTFINIALEPATGDINDFTMAEMLCRKDCEVHFYILINWVVN